LLSFLEYADRIQLSPDVPVYTGTHYEYTSALALLRLGFSLTRVGRKHDEGIDLIGHWIMTPLREPMPVFVQCKRRTCSLGPCHVRDLEGTFASIPAAWRNKGVLAILVSNLKATRGTLEAMSRSSRPMAYAMVSKQGIVQQFVWNRAASENGLEGLGVTLRHTPIVAQDETTPSCAGAKAKPKAAGTLKDIQLTWMGSPIFPERHLPRLDTLGLPASAVPPKLKKRKSETPYVSRKRTLHLAPSPRGGLFRPARKSLAASEAANDVIIETRGRPKGSKTKTGVDAPEKVKRPPGRPRGSTNKIKAAVFEKVKRPPGRPKGSKGKKKQVDAPEVVKRPRGRPKGSKAKKNNEEALVAQAVGDTVEKKTEGLLNADVDKG
jgi:hypothetical protein